MNAKYLISIVSSVLVIHASAATYVFNNNSGTSAHGIVDSDGDSFRSGTTVGQEFTAAGDYGTWTSAGPGVISVGFFTTDDLSELTATSLIAAFEAFGAAGTFGAGPSGQRGTFSLTPDAMIIDGSIFEDKNMYFFAGNGSTFGNSTEFLVLKHSTTFLATDDLIPTAISIQFNPTNSTVLFGVSLDDVRTTNNDGTETAGWGMAAPIPEPSVALLGAFGILALLRRRR